jgi:hypothetical protein
MTPEDSSPPSQMPVSSVQLIVSQTFDKVFSGYQLSIYQGTLMMMTEMDIETSVYYVHLTLLIAREDFIKFTRRESTKTYKVSQFSLRSA